MQLLSPLQIYQHKHYTQAFALFCDIFLYMSGKRTFCYHWSTHLLTFIVINILSLFTSVQNLGFLNKDQCIRLFEELNKYRYFAIHTSTCSMSILIMWIILVEGTTNQCLKWSMIIYKNFLWIMFCCHFMSQYEGMRFFSIVMYMWKHFWHPIISFYVSNPLKKKLEKELQTFDCRFYVRTALNGW